MNETRRAVLEALADGPASGPDLAESLDISRAAVWKHIEALREAEFAIESGPNGYELTDVTAYNGPSVEFGLEARFRSSTTTPWGITNDRAGARTGGRGTDVSVLADEQTGGRGRLEREWTAPSGGVWLSIVCRPDIAPARAPLYTLAVSVATATVARGGGVDARIKWPNDVVVPVDDAGEYRKLSGILTEMEGETDRVEWIIVGPGIARISTPTRFRRARPASARRRVTSIADGSSSDCSRSSTATGTISRTSFRRGGTSH